MAKLSHRFFALFFAILFLVTSSSVAIAFILANVEAKHNSGSATASQTPTQTPTQAPNTGKKLAGFTPVSSVSQLRATDIVVGKGPVVTSSNTVNVTYSGAVAATGIIFQSTSTPISISLNQVIPGWQQGIPGMKVGGTRQLLIPANLAYGANPPSGSGIPANAALVFIVTVTGIK